MNCEQTARHDVAMNALPMFGDFLLPALMEVAAAYPAICFRYRLSMAVQRLTASALGTPAPLGIGLRGRARPPASEGLSVRGLGVLNVGLFAAESHVVKHGRAERPADLAGHVLAHRDDADNAP